MIENQYKLDDPVEVMKKYHETGSVEIRNQLILHYSYIARSAAMQMRGIASNFAQVEDIVNEGVLTLIDCIEKFDIEKGVKFETYAYMRIRGSVIDFVRKQDWLPRRVRKTAKDIDRAYDELSNKYMREPKSSEIAEYLQISEEALSKHYSEISNSVLLSFEGVVQNTLQTGFADEGGTAGEDSQPENHIFHQELKDTLENSISELTEKEQTVLSLYYYESLKYSDIAKVLEVSESRVCQIHTKAILKLKGKMEHYVKG
ncbi:RNA polymerase sigma-28 (SigD/FliA/WhiG) subunit [Hydrogenoanaerobacterium saccharovorans]|uniref:RNA polymerase, sigma 28 subunit, SigD/FliA/WhiG n=1 Tax=Hydrogenoanaerobacterium saccharovorans TaxID=474960 RepID=A0A1H7ZT10_9FIRM|nr:FliA/WhiG family RNA polymerase sigma factor [Hydrogenoanaerobacterium saccharovorans]RPF48407.1 RNA polymerase sigma-28 (SigD/FliA/WhiG) subunit [Hydrogenoanaerobacterium saccharovorans]SEM61451.1 RNA polymerase, sigma 28 subunit, SigD/FliA/WhiG [Hydrogenoanaerobacterium saccharovorans]